MLDQYRQDLNNDADNLGENRFQMSKRKVVFTLAGSALALLFFLFLIGAFRSEEELTSEKDQTHAVASELTDLQARVEKLEQLVLGTKPPLASANSAQEANQPLSDNALKQLIAANTAEISASQQDAPPPASYTPSDTQKQLAMDLNELPTPAPATAPAAATKTYVVQKGDTLSKISQKCYGTTKKWKQIYEANRDRISNINALKVGTKLTIPEEPKQ